MLDFNLTSKLHQPRAALFSGTVSEAFVKNLYDVISPEYLQMPGTMVYVLSNHFTSHVLVFLLGVVGINTDATKVLCHS